MRKFIAPVVVILIIIGFFGFVIYKDKQGDKKTADDKYAASQKTSPLEDAGTKTDTGSTTENVTNSDTSKDTMATGAKKLTKPSMQLDLSKTYKAVLHTDQGDITVDLTSKETPITVNNFVYLAKQKFYDGTIFHRVIKDFMIQGGDPTGTGSGGPGYKFDDEKFSGKYSPGTVAMANAGPNTNGSQFFIMHGSQDLPPNYVIFGHVEEGIDTVNKIATAPVEQSAMGEPSKPVTPVKIKTVDIVEE